MNTLISTNTLDSICKDNDIIFLGLFGSFARKEATEKSDIDLLVDFNETKSLFELARLKFAFENILKREVDLVQKNSLKSKLKPYIYKDLEILYEKIN